MQREKSTYEAIVFLCLLPFLFFVVSIVWHVFITNRLYVCTDAMVFASFIPPWVHEQVSGDYFIASPPVVAGIWLALVGGGVWLSRVASQKITRIKEL